MPPAGGQVVAGFGLSLRPAMKRPAGKPSAAPKATRARHAVWWIVLLVLVALGGAALAWRQHRLTTDLEAELPVRPSLAGQPAVLAELLDQAESRLRSGDTRLAGLADLGRLYHANGFPAEAAECWRLLRARDPAEPRWPYYLADLSRSASDHATTRSRLQETLLLAPDYAPARLLLADLQFKSGERADAADNYRRRLAALPHDPHARLGLARLALQQERTDEARAELEMLLKHAPNFSTAHNLYAELLAAAGDTAGAGRHRWLGQETQRYRDAEDPWLEELLAWCHDYDRLCLAGTREMHLENHDAARALFVRAIALKPGETQAYELLGSLHLKRHEAGQARDLLTRALTLTTGRNSPVLFTTLSRAYRELGQPAEAERVAREGLDRLGRQPELLDALGLSLSVVGRQEEAIAAWQQALEKEPNDAGINHNLATALLALGRLDDALAALARSLTLRPTFLPTLLLRGEIELEAGHLDAAENHLRRAFDLHPGDATARRLLARWHLKMGAAAESRQDPAVAERHYRDGLVLEAGHAELLVSLGAFYLVQSRPADAIEPLLAYHRQKPDSPEGFLFLGQAYAGAGHRDPARALLTQGAELADRLGRTRIATHCRSLLEKL